MRLNMQSDFETMMCSLATLIPKKDIDKIRELSVGKEEESMKEILSVMKQTQSLMQNHRNNPSVPMSDLELTRDKEGVKLKNKKHGRRGHHRQ